MILSTIEIIDGEINAISRIGYGWMYKNQGLKI